MSLLEREAVFVALADPHRRLLLDRLRMENGQTLSQLCRDLPISRQAITRHIGVLEAANLVLTRREGRTKLHFLNPVPIHAVAQRWLGLFDGVRLDALFAHERDVKAR